MSDRRKVVTQYAIRHPGGEVGVFRLEKYPDFGNVHELCEHFNRRFPEDGTCTVVKRTVVTLYGDWEDDNA